MSARAKQRWFRRVALAGAILASAVLTLGAMPRPAAAQYYGYPYAYPYSPYYAGYPYYPYYYGYPYSWGPGFSFYFGPGYYGGHHGGGHHGGGPH